MEAASPRGNGAPGGWTVPRKTDMQLFIRLCVLSGIVNGGYIGIHPALESSRLILPFDRLTEIVIPA